MWSEGVMRRFLTASYACVLCFLATLSPSALRADPVVIPLSDHIRARGPLRGIEGMEQPPAHHGGWALNDPDALDRRARTQEYLTRTFGLRGRPETDVNSGSLPDAVWLSADPGEPLPAWGDGQGDALFERWSGSRSTQTTDPPEAYVFEGNSLRSIFGVADLALAAEGSEHLLHWTAGSGNAPAEGPGGGQPSQPISRVLESTSAAVFVCAFGLVVVAAQYYRTKRNMV